MSKTARWYMNFAISVGIMIFFRFLPAPEPITATGMTLIGIFIGAIYGWCTTNMVGPSIVAMCFLAFTTNADCATIWKNLIGNNLIQISFWLMIAVGFLSNTGLSEWVANWSITRKWTKGRPWLLMTVIFLSDLVACCFVAGVPVILLYWSLMWALCDKVGIKKGSRTAAWMCASVITIGIGGAYLMPFKGATIACFGFLASGSNGLFDGTYSYTMWLLFAIIHTGICIAAYMLISKYIFKIDLSAFVEYDPGAVEFDQKLNKRQKYCAILFGIMFVLLMLPSVLPAGSDALKFVNTFNVQGIGMIMIAVGVMIRIDGEPLLLFRDMANQNIIWDVIFMFGTALSVATALNAPATGFSTFVSTNITTLLGDSGAIVYLVVILLISVFVTNLINNNVVSAIMIPVSFNLSMVYGLNPIAVGALLVLFTDFGFLLPSSSPAGAMLHTNEGWIPKKYIYVFAGTMLAIMIVSGFTIAWPLANVMFPWSI